MAEKRRFHKEMAREELVRVVLAYMEQIGRQNDADNMEALLKAMVREIFTSEWALLWWPESAGQQMVSHTPEASPRTVAVSTLSGLIGKASANKMPFFSNYVMVDNDGFVAEIDNARGLEIGKNMLLLPVSDGSGELVALFQLMTHKADLHQYTEHDIELFHAIEPFTLRMLNLILRKRHGGGEVDLAPASGPNVLETITSRMELVRIIGQEIGHELPEAVAHVCGRTNALSACTELEQKLGYFKLFKLLQEDLCMVKCSDDSTMETTPQEVSLLRFFAGYDAFFRPLAQAQGTVLTLFVSPNLPAAVRTDPHRLAEAFSILTFNAIKALGGGGRVECAVGYEGGKIVFTVSDSDAPLSEAERAKLFEPYEAELNPAVRTHAMPVMAAACASVGATTWSASSERGNIFGVTLVPEIVDASVFYDPRELSRCKVLVWIERAEIGDQLQRYFSAFGITPEHITFIDSTDTMETEGVSHIFFDSGKFDREAVQGLRELNIVPVAVSGGGEVAEGTYPLEETLPVRKVHALLQLNLRLRRVLFLDVEQDVSEKFRDHVSDTIEMVMDVVDDVEKLVRQYRDRQHALKHYDLIVIADNGANGMLSKSAVRSIFAYNEKSGRNHVPVVAILSSMTTEREIDRYLASGVDDVLLKPLGKRAFMSLVDRYL